MRVSGTRHILFAVFGNDPAVYFPGSEFFSYINSNNGITSATSVFGGYVSGCSYPTVVVYGTVFDFPDKDLHLSCLGYTLFVVYWNASAVYSRFGAV